jgi:membrane associated rhomboid family serine protease
MIPIQDSIPRYSKPYVTWGIMAICIVVFLLMLLMPGYMAQRFLSLYGMVPLRYSNPQWSAHYGLPPDYHLSFLTSLFLHGGWGHIAMNMLFMWVFADSVEDLMGHKRFLVFYLLSGLIAVYVQWYFSQDLVIPVVGASGAIYGVLGAYCFRVRASVTVPIPFYPLSFQIPVVALLGLWVIFQLWDMSTAAIFAGMATQTAWWSHLGGFVAGAALHWFFIDKPQVMVIPEDVAE